MCGYDFHRQKQIDKYIVDFYCPDLFLAIELDGVSHFGKEEYDEKRQKRLESLGVRKKSERKRNLLYHYLMLLRSEFQPTLLSPPREGKITSTMEHRRNASGKDIYELRLINSSFYSIINSTNRKVVNMAQIITANDLKTKGVSILDKETSEGAEVIVTVRGKNKYVVVPIEKYNRLREYELEAALLETKRDIKEGKFVKESVEKHIKRIARG